MTEITSKKYSNGDVDVKDNGSLKNGDKVKINAYDLYEGGKGTHFSGSHYITVKVSGLTDLSKISNLDEIINLNTEQAKNENKSGEYETYKIENLHTYASEDQEDDMFSQDEPVSETVSINSEVTNPEISIYTLFKIDETTDFDSDTTSTYKAYGLKGLKVSDGKVDISGKDVESDGV